MDENRFEGTARNFGGKVQESVGNMTGDTKSQVEGMARQAAGKAQDMYGSARDQAQSMARTVSDGVEQQPLVALLVAGAVGFGLGLLSGRR